MFAVHFTYTNDKHKANGILNYNGTNTLAIALWAQDTTGNKLNSLSLNINKKVQGGIRIVNSPMPTWSKRVGAY